MVRLIELVTETEETTEAAAPKRGVSFILAAALLLPVLYVLSSGPVLWIFNKTGLFRSTAAQHFIQVFYAPLEWAYMHNDFAKRFLESYLVWIGAR